MRVDNELILKIQPKYWIMFKFYTSSLMGCERKMNFNLSWSPHPTSISALHIEHGNSQEDINILWNVSSMSAWAKVKYQFQIPRTQKKVWWEKIQNENWQIVTNS